MTIAGQDGQHVETSIVDFGTSQPYNLSVWY